MAPKRKIVWKKLKPIHPHWNTDHLSPEEQALVKRLLWIRNNGLFAPWDDVYANMKEDDRKKAKRKKKN